MDRRPKCAGKGEFTRRKSGRATSESENGHAKRGPVGDFADTAVFFFKLSVFRLVRLGVASETCSFTSQLFGVGSRRVAAHVNLSRRALYMEQLSAGCLQAGT